jgi:hypothetical protein
LLHCKIKGLPPPGRNAVWAIVPSSQEFWGSGLMSTRERIKTMNRTSTTAVCAALAGVCTVAAGALAAAASDIKAPLLTPGKGVSLDVGSKRAIAYFLSENATCKVTLVLAEAARDGNVPAHAATRVTVAVAPGQSARVDADGKAVEFVCRASAATMMVKAPDASAAAQPG